MKNLFILFFITWTSCLVGQKPPKVNSILEQNAAIYHLEEPLELWLNFLNSDSDSSASVYWNKKEVDSLGRKSYFMMRDLDYVQMDDIVQSLKFGTTVLSITKYQDLYKITSQLEIQADEKNAVKLFVFHVYAGIEPVSKKLKLYNPLPINLKRSMNEKQVGSIKYYFPKGQELKSDLTLKQQEVMNKFTQEFGYPPIQSKFIFTATREELQRLQGFDSHCQVLGNEYPTGLADVDRKIVFSSGTDGFHPHELIHLYINPTFPDAHLWLIEGLATFYGGSRGLTLDAHLAKLKKHLVKHPEIDLNQLLKLVNLDDETSYNYVLGGYIIRLAMEKGGVALVKQLLTEVKTDKDLYAALETHLGMPQQTLNTALREKLK